MQRWIGIWIVCVGVVHTVFGLVFHFQIHLQLASGGFFNTVNGQLDRELAFWFVYWGLMAMLLGYLVDWVERRRWPLPRFLGWALLALTVMTVFVMPISGLWLMLPPAVGALFGADGVVPPSDVAEPGTH
jgi:hypothetical protein